MAAPPWWAGAVGYECYVRSFRDSNGDGIGDLGGVREGLNHLAAVGVDLLWLSPITVSPQRDHGYDVADYRSIEPAYGDDADLDALLHEAHARGMHVIMDLVPNHSSDQHPWFRAALGNLDADTRNYYVWRDPAPDGGPPNNWVSHFGGPAWTLDEATGQYYMHLFLPEQPDLNWANEAVRAEFDAILRHWFERGVDGFRIDVAHSLVEDPQFRDNPLKNEHAPAPGTHPREVFAAYEHIHDLDQPDVVEIFERWRRIADEYDALLLGEVYLLDPRRLARYVDDGRLHLSFCFPVLKTAWDAAEIRSVLQDAVGVAPGRLAWPLSSHDDPYAATRFGGGAAGRDRALAYLTLLSMLPGVPFLYQGEELGLENAVLDASVLQDPVSTRNAGALGRDGTRTPMPWQAGGPSFGFTDARTPWLPVGANRTAHDTVSFQEESANSHLQRVRRLLARRRHLQRRLGPVAWLDLSPDVVAYRRGDLMVVMNTGDDQISVEVGPAADVVFGSGRDGAPDVREGRVEVAPDTTAMLLDPR